MYVSAQATGTQTTVITTEHTLNSPAVAGRFKLLVDTTLMAAGDVLELRAKQIVLTGGTLRVVNFAQFSGAQPTDDLIKVLEIVDNELVEAGAVSFTMKQTFGTVHAFPWKVLNLTTTPANISALSIDANGRLDVIKIAGTTQTARDLGASVLLSTGTGTGQLDFTSGVVKANATQILGTAVSTPATAGILDVNVKNMNNVAATSITTINANQGTTQPVNFTGTGASALAKSDMVDVAGAAVSTSTAQLGVNAVNIGGTAQTGRDIGASVLLSSGTGTGQLDFTSGVVKANLAQILGTVLTETAGLLAGGFKKFFNVATPTGTLNSIPDAVAGANGGLFIAGTNAATTVTTSLTTTFTGNLTGSVGSVSGAVGSIATGGIAAASFAAGAIDASAIAADAIGASELALSAVAEIADAVWDEAISGHAAVGSTGEALSAAGSAGDPWTTALPGAYGAGTAGKIIGDNIDATIASRATQTSVDTIDDFLDTEVAAIKLKTDLIPASPAAVGDIPTANANADALLDRTSGVETGLTPRGALRLALAALAGKASGMETTTAIFRNAVADSKDRITATVDADGNRSAISTDVS